MAIIKKRNHRLLREGLRNRQSIRKSVKILAEQAYNSYNRPAWATEELNAAIDNVFTYLNEVSYPGKAFYITDIRPELEERHPEIFNGELSDGDINNAIREVAKRMEDEGLIDNIIFVDDDTYYDYD